jgi:hypothetical protein
MHASLTSQHSFFTVRLLSELFYIQTPYSPLAATFPPLYYSDSGWNHVCLQCSIAKSLKTASDSLFLLLVPPFKGLLVLFYKKNPPSSQPVTDILKGNKTKGLEVC